MKHTFVVLSLSALVLLSACSDEKVVPLKSPCVGIVDSPCGPKRAVNKDMVQDTHQPLVRASV